MACLDLESSQELSTHQSFEDSFDLALEESISDEGLDAYEASTSSPYHISNIPEPPPVPGTSNVSTNFFKKSAGYCYAPKETLQTWDRLFKEGYRADVHVITDGEDMVPAHSCVLGIVSPAMRDLLEQARVKEGLRCIEIPGVPSKSVHAFIRFLYSSCYEMDEMKKFALHLLVLAHIFCVPSLKKVCIDQLQQALLTTENVVDVLQLARQCDAPRLSLFCIRLVMKEFKTISASDGWKVMRQANPGLEQEILECLVDADSRKKDKLKKIEEKKVYLQLNEAMEALLHICKDGCQTIGPRDKVLKGSQVTCSFSACKGLESLVRHFSGCKIRVPGGCTHCKRMWQLLELHSRVCAEPDSCKVPLCRHFKDKLPYPSKKEEQKWKLLVRKVMAVKGTFSSIVTQGSPII